MLLGAGRRWLAPAARRAVGGCQTQTTPSARTGGAGRCHVGGTVPDEHRALRLGVQPAQGEVQPVGGRFGWRVLPGDDDVQQFGQGRRQQPPQAVGVLDRDRAQRSQSAAVPGCWR